MKLAKRIITAALAVVLVLSLSGCGRFSPENKELQAGQDAFNNIVKAYPQNKGFHNALSHWGFKLPDGYKFEWTKDMSANKADFAMVMLADPLVNAGLDVTKLDANEWIYKPAGKDEGVDLPNLLIKPYNVSDKKVNSNGSEDALRRLLKEDPSLLKYHKEQQHYRLMLSEGFEVQWTEKLGINDADMVFVVKAEPLVKAGLDVNKLQGTGWIFRPAGDDPSGMGKNPDQIVRVFKLK
jgi:hypothetical protein